MCIWKYKLKWILLRTFFSTSLSWKNGHPPQLAMTFTLKCRYIDSHYGIVRPFSYFSSGWCTWHILAYVLTFDVMYACLWSNAKPLCVLLCLVHIIFNLSISAITDHLQWRTYVHILSSICVKDPDYRKPVLILPNGRWQISSPMVHKSEGSQVEGSQVWRVTSPKGHKSERSQVWSVTNPKIVCKFYKIIGRVTCLKGQKSKLSKVWKIPSPKGHNSENSMYILQDYFNGHKSESHKSERPQVKMVTSLKGHKYENAM